MARIADDASTGFARRSGRGLVAYVTAGDPDLARTARDPAWRSRGDGADVIEVGVPFSDPIADGPAIQRAIRARAGRRHDPARRARR